jgi:hypothetical protein
MAVQRERLILSRSEEVRSSNDHIAQQAVRLRFVSRVPMLCECSDPGCHSIILLDRERYEELRADGFFTIPGHSVDGAEPALRENGFWLQRGGTSSRARR